MQQHKILQTTNARAEGESARDIHRIREAVAVFDREDDFHRAAMDLMEHGFDRSDLSILASSKHAVEHLKRHYPEIDRFDGGAQSIREEYHEQESVVEAKTLAVGLPLYVGAVGGFLAVAASGGTLALGVSAALAGGLAGTGIGAIGANAVGRRQRESIERQLAAEGIVLWVQTRTEGQEFKALNLLRERGGRDVHLHTATITWGEDDVPLSHFNPDPFLENSHQAK
ncbi:MAG: hypothetical protein H6888_04675 [Nitratireductor sp.]|nr:hypothetical protein [Nitratireductor sp.]